MKCFSTAVLASLVVAIPIVNAYPSNDIPVFSIQKSFEIPDSQNFSYDEIIDLLALIESDDSLEERCSIDQLDQMNRLMSFLAMEGATENEKGDVAMSITNLFETDDCQYAYWINSNTQYTDQPAIFRNGPQKFVLCKSWFKKQWDQTRKFVKEYKKEIIIGVIVAIVVTAVIVAGVYMAPAAAEAIAGGLGASAAALEAASNHSETQDHASYLEPESLETSHEEFLKTSLRGQITTFKENIAQEQLEAISGSNEISIEENGRILGSLFTHKTIDILSTQAAENPFLYSELQNFGKDNCYPLPKWANSPNLSPHALTDLAFSTHYSPTYASNNTDLNTLTYQARGDWALSSGCYAQALQDFGRAVEIEPNNPNSYLGRGIANFELGRYEESIADYTHYVSQIKEPFSVTDFSIGFAKGLPKGVYDSGEGMLLFITDLACHPVQTSAKVYDSISTLNSLAKSGEWNLIGETLSPELHKLISEWDTLSAKEKGELSGYAFGKHGADILLPGATAKVVAKGSIAAKELGSICQNLQSAEKLLVLEAVAEGGSAGINVGEVVISAQKTLAAGEDLGFTTKEMAILKQSGELEQVIGKGRDFFAGNPEMQASFDRFRNAEEFLRNYREFMPEAQAHELIRQAGINTFPKPIGIPENFRVKITNNGVGMKYIHPNHEQTYVRIMPGKPHSRNPAQQKPYVTWMKNGEALDKNGNVVDKRSFEAHILIEDFKYVQ